MRNSFTVYILITALLFIWHFLTIYFLPIEYVLTFYVILGFIAWAVIVGVFSEWICK